MQYELSIKYTINEWKCKLVCIIAGFSDITACYQCGFVYKNWQKDEDPILIHIKNQPDCQHIEDLKRKNIHSCKHLDNDSENVSCILYNVDFLLVNIDMDCYLYL